MPEQAAAGDLRLITNAMVIAEIVWTLESLYRLHGADVAAKVTVILKTPGLEVAEASLLLEAVADYVDFNVDFIDAYNGAWVRKQGLTEVITFGQRHLSRLHGIQISVPRSGVRHDKQNTHSGA